jgi:S-formylglutathione hydrolase
MNINNTSSTLLEDTFLAGSTRSSVDYCVLIPANFDPNERLPLILHLHGAMSSAVRSLEMAKPIYDASWASEDLPRAIVACVTTPTIGGFYIDQAGGPGWETLVAQEFPDMVTDRFRTDGSRVVIGTSMGGYGALKIAFRNPERYAAVAAMCPVIFPAESRSAVEERHRPSILDELHRTMGSDDATYQGNSVYSILRSKENILRSAETAIFIDCGDADEFELHDGALFLHHLLKELEVQHEFRSVAGAGHADAAASRRLSDALSFIGHRLAVSA